MHHISINVFGSRLVWFIVSCIELLPSRIGKIYLFDQLFRRSRIDASLACSCIVLIKLRALAHAREIKQLNIQHLNKRHESITNEARI